MERELDMFLIFGYYHSYRVRMCLTGHMEARGQLCGVGPLLLLFCDF